MCYSFFTHYILGINYTYFKMDFHSTHVFSVKKGDNSSAELRKKKTLGNQSCDGLQGGESCDATSYVQALSHINCLK
jgi:hypothetical protein